jgi:hypothetical protein
MVTEQQKEAIRKEARTILDGFAKTLDKVTVSEHIHLSGTNGRKEGFGVECDPDFRNRLFENAPKKNKDFLIAEKGAWN